MSAEDGKRSQVYRPNCGVTGTRNRRSVWTINTQPYKGPHFAAFPEELALTCILAGTSEYGCCAQCGVPYARIIEKDDAAFYWQQKCKCDSHDVAPCVVLDIFNGTGTTGAVAMALNRSYIGIDLNADYNALAHSRIRGGLKNRKLLARLNPPVHELPKLPAPAPSLW
jgi:hypothetical protein